MPKQLFVQLYVIVHSIYMWWHFTIPLEDWWFMDQAKESFSLETLKEIVYSKSPKINAYGCVKLQS